MRRVQLGRLLRTALHLRPIQIFAQIRDTFTPAVSPVAESFDVPKRSVLQSHTDFLPAPEHAHFDAWRSITLVGRRVDFRDGINWNHQGEGPLWAFHLHQFDYLRDPALSSAARLRLIEDWIAHCRSGIGWSPHPMSLRILSWGKLLLMPGALCLDDAEERRIHASLALQTETLARNLEVRVQANHLFSNLLSVVFAGLLFEGPDADRWLAHEADLRREIDLQVLPDGAHVETSPMYHGLLMENLLDLLNLARAAETRTPTALLASLENAAARMLAAHRVWRHRDGEIALLADSAFGIAQPPELLEAYAEDLGIRIAEPVQPGYLPDAGVVRLDCGSFRLIMTAGPPTPSFQPGHAHCDALSFELSVKGERVVTDTGVSEYIPGPLRDASRRTLSHATIEIAGQEQAEVWAAHRVGGRSRVQIQRVVANQEILASCTGWRDRGCRHERHIEVQGGSLVVKDRLEGGPRPVRMSLPLAPGLAPKLVRRRTASDSRSDAWELLATLSGGLEFCVELPEGVDWRLEPAPYFPRFGSNVERVCLTGHARDFDEGRWRFSLRRPDAASRRGRGRATTGSRARPPRGRHR